MQTATYSQAGTYAALVGLIVTILGFLGYSFPAGFTSQVVQAVGDLVTVGGALYQAYLHRQLAVAAGIK